MGSAHKTPFLGLNQWLGTDKPKREDFNSDNLNVEAKVKAHCENAAAHVTAQERNAWNKSVYTVGTYAGNGAGPTRSINLGFQPKLLFVYAVGKPMIDYRAAFDSSSIYSALYTPHGATYGLEVNAGGFTVRNSSNSVAGGSTCALNLQGLTYVYIVLK